MRALSTILLLAITTGFAPHAASQTQPADSRLCVVVRAASDVPGRTFTLGEIADISGPDRALAAQVASIEAGTSPLPGLSRGIFRGDVLARLRYNHVDPKQVDLVCPPSVRITRGGAEVPSAEILQAATDALQAARKGVDDNATLEPAPITAHLFVPAGKREYQAGAPRGQLTGTSVTVPVSVIVDGRPSKTVDVPFRIRRMTRVVVAKRALEAHAVLGVDDLSLATVELAPGAPAPLASIEPLVGKRTTRAVAMGMPIAASAVESAPVITAGTKVMVEVSVGGVKISAPALARTPGAVGESIRVYTTETHKELTGIVVDGETVRVEENP